MTRHGFSCHRIVPSTVRVESYRTREQETCSMAKNAESLSLHIEFCPSGLCFTVRAFEINRSRVSFTEVHITSASRLFHKNIPCARERFRLTLPLSLVSNPPASTSMTPKKQSSLRVKHVAQGGATHPSSSRSRNDCLHRPPCCRGT